MRKYEEEDRKQEKRENGTRKGESRRGREKMSTNKRNVNYFVCFFFMFVCVTVNYFFVVIREKISRKNERTTQKISIFHVLQFFPFLCPIANHSHRSSLICSFLKSN